MAKISVIILNWNGEELLKQFLPLVVAHSMDEEWEVVVADNGSTDGSIALLSNHFSDVKLIRLAQNYGFAEGYNKAIKQVDSEYVILLNSDVETTPGWISPLVSYLDNHPEVAALQPSIRSFHHRNSFEYAGAAGGLMDYYGFPFCRGRILDTVEEDKGQYTDVLPLFWATGACLCIRRSDFLEAGGLDGRFFAHMEEIDLCWRLNARGRGVVCIPSSVVYHVGGASLAMGNPRKLYLNFRNNLLMLYKNLPKRDFFPVFAMRPLFDLLAAVHLLLQGKVKSFLAVFKAYRDFLRMKASYKEVRQENLRRTKVTDIPGLYRGSMILSYYLRNKRTYSSLISNNKVATRSEN